MEKLDIGTITPAHKLPFMVERHTQQGVDEYHAEENQDRHYIGYDFARKMAWLAIADGHVGSGAADYVTRYVVKNIQSLMPKGTAVQSVEELQDYIVKGIKVTEERFKHQDDASGACLLLVCLWERVMVVANVGDSRAVLGMSLALSSSCCPCCSFLV
jgi:serine/threonine protein phosphatase PrpC